ncbi:SOUL family heme-binding protein [Maribellus sediminis]|uniref:SOUL family heme-binding protein n=1 Tax=Maribellus sediminis TaxID=2696285 RepID=UPI00142FA16E|nr:heme-binding protein [Maribellus sediminis]
MILIVTFITLGVFLVTSLHNKSHAETEIQPYETLYQSGNFEIRFYPQAILASVVMNENLDKSRNSGFRVLAGYIFGGNEENQKIAMTAPVRMSNTADSSTMSFVLPSEMNFNQLPEPLNKDIVLHRSEPAYAAVVRFGGYTSNREIEIHRKELIAALEKLGISHKGNFEYLGYNAPYDVFDRRNEVWVELKDFDPGMLQSITVK